MLTHKPQLVERLKGIPLAQIAAGGAHSITVSLSGAVYSWGKNSFGQLGLGDTKGKEEEHQEGVFLVSSVSSPNRASVLSSSCGVAVDSKVF